MQIDFTKIFSVVQKGMGVIETLIAQEQSAVPAITAVKNLVASAADGKVTADQIIATEATLDALIDEFNEPMG